MTMHVACAADEAYVGHCAAMLHSLLARHADDGVVVHFLHAPAFDARERARLVGHIERNGGRVELHALDDACIAGLPAIAGIPPIMWYRVFLPELLPAVDRVLYLDADTLVVDDLRPLWREPLDGAYVAAVPNVLETAHANHARAGTARRPAVFQQWRAALQPRRDAGRRLHGAHHELRRAASACAGPIRTRSTRSSAVGAGRYIRAGTA